MVVQHARPRLDRKNGKPRRRTRGSPMVRESPEEAARRAQLRYVTDATPGIRRVGTGLRVRYVAADGSRISSRDEVQRIRRLAIPPAWTQVWICPNPNGHLQATGRDARGRKQYRYHQRWREVRDEDKYARLLEFADARSRIAAQVERDIAATGFPREKVLAMIVKLLETTFARIGNESYARQNGSFGLTTLKNRHIKSERSGLRLRFRGKSGVLHDVMVTDRRLARLVRRIREIPGQDLFQYLDAEGNPQPVSSTDVNEYLKAAAGADFTAKDYRTWAGTLLAMRYTLANAADLEAPAPKAFIVALVKHVATSLGNTPAVCRKCYIHPAVLNAAMDEGSLARLATLSNGLSPGRDDAGWEDVLRKFLGAQSTL
jgi:DNA topoisomerase-1